MSTITKQVNPIYDHALETDILRVAGIELLTITSHNGNVLNGIERRTRNRLMKEAGLDYNQAHAAFYSLRNSIRKAN